MTSLPEPPAQLKAIQSFMRTAQDVERVDPVVAYWVRLYSTESALKIDKDSPECKTFLGTLILWLEDFKKNHKENEAVTNQTVGQAHMENFVVSLFNKVDTLDRNGTANKNTVRMFYMAAVLFEAMAVFGTLTDEVSKRAKYAKFKAAYIQKCLKTGQTPKPGPLEGPDLEGESGAAADSSSATDQTASDPSVKFPPAPVQSTSDAEKPMPSGSNMPAKPSDSDRTIPSTAKNLDSFIMTPSNPPPRPHNPGLAPTTPNTSGVSSKETRSTIGETSFHAINGASLNPDDIILGQKYCKFANSALQYDDIQTAVLNLEKALKLLKTGQRSE